MSKKSKAKEPKEPKETKQDLNLTPQKEATSLPPMKAADYESFMSLLNKTSGKLDFRKSGEVKIEISLKNATIAIQGVTFREALENLHRAIVGLPQDCKELSDQLALF